VDTGVRAGSVAELEKRGCLLTKVGAHPVCVFWHDGRPWALEDRCPHMGFPLHRGTVENGLVTCHWHHARFDLSSGGTLDPFADDARSYPVRVVGEDVYVLPVAVQDQVSHQLRRLEEGLEQGLSLVIAKAVLGLLSAGVPTTDIVAAGLEFGTRYRDRGWGAGLTVLVAMANVLEDLDSQDRPLALVHGLAFVSRDTRGHPPHFGLAPLPTHSLDRQRLTGWYRRFIDTRSAEAAERTLRSALELPLDLKEVEAMMEATVTDHVFLDEGHTLDFTNKAFEALGHVGARHAGLVLPSLVAGTASAFRSEESGQWRHPHDLVGLVEEGCRRLPGLVEAAGGLEGAPGIAEEQVAALGWSLLDEDPGEVLEHLCRALAEGARPEQLGRAVAFAAALRIVRFHTQNDHADWDVVHHGFTAANALHQALCRAPTPELMRGLFHCALKVFLDRFLNVPPARLPAPGGPVELEDLRRCWDEQGKVDEAGAIAYQFISSGGRPERLIAALGSALLAEDAEFHWFQTFEAAVRQHRAWPEGSEEGALVLVAAARFLAAHTPTRRGLPQVVRIASRLRRGEQLFEEDPA
jgi:nitrite reductase/ring-hydroxylating ferredoxin subunit